MTKNIILKKGKRYILFNKENLKALELDKGAIRAYEKFNKKSILIKKEKEIIDFIKENDFFNDSSIKGSQSRHIISSYRIVLTEKCNLNCKYCFVKKNNKILNEMSLKTLKNFIKKSFKNTNVKSFRYHFFGGEPLLKFDLIRYAVNLIKSEEIEYSITTNGTLITEDIARFFKKHNFRVGVSIDGREYENNHLRKGIKSTFLRSLHGIKLLEKQGVKWFILITPYPENFASFLKTVEFFIKRLKAKKIVINTPFDKNFGWMIDGKVFAYLLIKSIKLCDKYGVDLDSAANPLMYSIINNTKRKSTCFYNNKEVMQSVSPLGKISYCSQYWGERIINKKLKDYKKFYFERNNKSCKNCFAEGICGGPCPIYQRFSNNLLDKNKCSFQKEFLKEYLFDKKL